MKTPIPTKNLFGLKYGLFKIALPISNALIITHRAYVS